MAKKYIDLQEAEGQIDKDIYSTAGEKVYTKYIIRKTPAADVAPVVHGRWEWFGPCYDGQGQFWGTCSACKLRQRLGDYRSQCPNCGAKMDGGAESG